MKKFLKSFSAFLFTLIVVLTNTDVTNAAPKYNRIYGKGRYETSASIVNTGWEKSEYAVIASGEGFADALSAAPLAKKYNAPIILTEGKNLNGNAKNQLKRLDVKNVIIVGGTGSISANTEKQINNLGISTRRIYGKSRFDTSLEVAKEIGVENGIVVTNGLGFADALSMAPIAANKQMPIILTPANNLPKNIKDFINSNSYGKSYILGGNGVVSNTIQGDLKNSKRLYGNSRYDTNAAILKEFSEEVNLDNIYVAAGSNYPDALSGSALAARNNSPIVLVSNKVEASVMSFIKNKHSNFNNINIIGGSGVVSDTTVKTVVDGKEVGDLKVHYIDVGQGDSILIQQDGHNMLIDAGKNSSEKVVLDYLKSHGVTKLDYVIGTHPHEDHIGGLDAVINNFEIGQVFMPKVTHTSQTFKSVVTAITNKGLKITTPKIGDSYGLGNARWEIIAPVSASYDNLNNYSIVTKLKFGNNSFIFTGDAESLSEGEILKKQLDISSDVLKVGHHGSRTSTTQNFLNKVNPKYAVISVGKGNSYKHPNQEILNRLKSKNVKVYRTDENGTVVATSDGTSIRFNKSPGSYKGNDVVVPIQKPSIKPQPKPVPKPSPKPVIKPQPSDNKSVTVYITKTGKKYHRNGCRYLRKSKIPINKNDAINRGYGSCGICNP
ncbi:cell wall-binding repeat-containing protein [Clostridium cochlearium]|uniref:Metallo beta-lactamase superfamily hydrolase n=1 Tax=Clostridium cochlearium TaxID=1494 RepID=A0A2X2WBF5_CLOCO|nr:cell wall-binding repeat-containing protein [Clostridium cochlearium]SQB33375.1 metallo beta-lactamase superfamily hydrolase [Clostridium cochlearium]